MDRIFIVELEVDAIERILFIAVGVKHLELAGIEKTPGIQAAEREKVPPARTPVGDVGSRVDEPKVPYEP